jgi:hypothetical protein
MNFRGIVFIILLILTPALEFILRASHIGWLVNLQVIYMTALLIMQYRKKSVGLVYLIIGSAVVEFLSLQKLVGLDALGFFLAIALISLIYRFISLLGRENAYLKLNILLVTAILFGHVLLLINSLDSQLALGNIIVNLVVMSVLITITEVLHTPKNALKT